MGGSVGDGCRGRHSNARRAPPVQRIRCVAWQRRRELGLESSRQPLVAQRRLSGQLPSPQQRSDLSGQRGYIRPGGISGKGDVSGKGMFQTNNAVANLIPPDLHEISPKIYLI